MKASELNATWKSYIDDFWQELIEADDRTSPPEFPDMALITKDELATVVEFVRRASLFALATGAREPSTEEDDGWMPIETAPKDGTWIEAFRPPTQDGWWQSRIVVRWYEFDDGNAAWVWPDEDYDAMVAAERAQEMIETGNCYEDANHFTHWRPLPAPPRVSAPFHPSAEHRSSLSQAAHDVLAERQRQTSVEGWTPEHDDTHVNGELTAAAICYAHTGVRSHLHLFNQLWPWSSDWWKPTNPRRNRVKAAALIIADIERLDRAFSHQSQRSTG